MKNYLKLLSLGILIGVLSLQPIQAEGSSHMDAPLITLDDPANTTDVYAFRSESEDGGIQYLTTAVAVYPFEEPGIGPNNYRFDDNVLYEIHIALGDDIDRGRKTISYQFRFETQFKNPNTTLQAFLGPITCEPGILDSDGFDPNQNLRQVYMVTRVDHRDDDDDDDLDSDDEEGDDDNGGKRVLGTGSVPPNNQGLVTAVYNMPDGAVAGEGVAKPGVTTEGELDSCTQFGITELDFGYRAFAAQRDDGFYADIQSIFDLDFSFGGPNKPFDSQGGFNVHTIVLNIPLSELEGAERAGVYATTSRRQITTLREDRRFQRKGDKTKGRFIQVARQGNPLFNEALVHVRLEDLYNRTDPTRDDDLFREFAENPLAELADLGLTLNDVSGIFIPDLIRVDLTTGPARLAGPPDDTDFSRLSVFGGDTLTNGNGDAVPGGFPNGRRFGDDVLDIALIALGLPHPELGPSPPAPPAGAPTADDGVDANDISFNRVFPYAATPLNGRSHTHH